MRNSRIIINKVQTNKNDLLSTLIQLMDKNYQLLVQIAHKLQSLNHLNWCKILSSNRSFLLFLTTVIRIKNDALPMESHLPKLRHLLLLRPEGP